MGVKQKYVNKQNNVRLVLVFLLTLHLRNLKINRSQHMKRFLLSIGLSLITSIIYANNVEVIYKGPRYIGDWETIELSSIKFHDLEIGDTIYVYATKTDSTSLGAFQDHEWQALPGVMNGGPITGDFELVINDTEVLISKSFTRQKTSYS